MNEFINTQNQKISDYDQDLSKFLVAESQRQEEHIELIASENYASKRVLEAQGSVLTNKYAEGYPNKRYYGGCEHVDGAETLAIERAKILFDAKFANVQPHSGASANAAVFLALLEPGDTFLGMALDQGGHLTHGAKVNFSGKNFNAIQYGLDPETGDFVRKFLENYQKEKKTSILLASHNMTEVERLCSFVIMMNKGSIIDKGKPKELIKKHNRKHMEEVFLKLTREKYEFK